MTLRPQPQDLLAAFPNLSALLYRRPNSVTDYYLLHYGGMALLLQVKPRSRKPLRFYFCD